jgi:hypothetical protein
LPSEEANVIAEPAIYMVTAYCNVPSNIETSIVVVEFPRPRETCHERNVSLKKQQMACLITKP